MLPGNKYILFRREWDATRGKWQKIPCDATGATIDAHDASQWRGYDEVAPAATWDESRPGAPYGVAWVLNGDGWFFLDIDDALMPDGSWSPDAAALWQSFNGALGEVSTSGNGLHIFGHCDPTLPETHRNKFAGPSGKLDREFYTAGRFVALSRGGPQPIGGQWVTRDWTDQLRRIVPQREDLGALPEGVDPDYTGPDDDDQLIAMALRSQPAGAAFGGKATFADLWNADAARLAQFYPAEDGHGFDHSSADMALMTLLAFWAGKDMPRMDRLFRRSGLMREKYEKRPDYQRETVGKAARLCRAVYNRPRPETAPGAAAGGDVPEMWLTLPEMQKHFDGCVYIRDVHRVLVPDGALLKPEQFKASYGGHVFTMRADGTKPTTNAFEAFTETTVHRFPRGIRAVFEPKDPRGTIYPDGGVNIYVPDYCGKRTPGDVTPFLDHMARIIPNASDRAILMAYCAAVVQYPGSKFQWAPVLQGMEGNGKSLIAQCVKFAVGERYSFEPDTEKVNNQFNGWLENKLFIIAEEIHMKGRREVLDGLKTKVTSRQLSYEPKGAEQRMGNNYANWILCTNYKDAVIKTSTDRRYAIFFTPQQYQGDLERDGMAGDYFPQLYDWLRAGGYEHVAHYFATYQIPIELNPAVEFGGKAHRAPTTSSTDAAIAESAGGIELEILDAIESEKPGFRGGWISSKALMIHLQQVNLRVQKNTLKRILGEMGYVPWGRAPRPIMMEEGTRPNLWRKRMITGAGTIEEYLTAQGNGYV